MMRTQINQDGSQFNGNNTVYRGAIQQGNITNIQQTADKCLADLRVTDPRHDKQRIEDTKGGLLADSYVWVLSHPDFCQWRHNEDQRLLWVKGDPGKGKTMLLCGVIDELKKSPVEGRRLAYFFCQATIGRINTATAVLRGLIFMLLDQDASLVSYMKKKYDVAGEALFQGDNAWYALSEILTNMLHDPNLQGVCLLVDALDECIVGLPQLLKLIVETSQLSSVKWLVSSRNQSDIEEQIHNVAQRLSLEVNAESVASAVDIYITHKVSCLKKIKCYLDTTAEEVRQYLSSNAHGTFLWVALICDELEKAFAWEAVQTVESFPPGLGPLYHRMMEQISMSRHRALCYKILALIATVYRPLSFAESRIFIEEWKSILGDIRPLHDMIGLCGSFLTVREETVYFVHQSAKDFLMMKEQSAVLFPKSQTVIHKQIFSKSIRSMSQTLERDIYDLRNPGSSFDKIKTPTPDPLSSSRYSCVFWIDHLEDSGIIPKAGMSEVSMSATETPAMILKFLENHYLQWLEALSLTGNIPEGVKAMNKLDTISTNIDHQQLQDLIKDAHRFVLSYRGGIEMAPLQVYSSALLFSPLNSLIRNLDTSDFPSWVELKSKVQMDWSACLQTLGGGGGYFFESVATSFDDQLVVSSSDGLVRIWDATSGQCKRTLQRRTRSPAYSMALSHDSKYIALGTANGYGGGGLVEIWNTSSGDFIRTLTCRGTHVTSVAYSTNSQQITSGSEDGAVQIWEVDSGKLKREFETGKEVLTIASFENRQLVASGYAHIKIWDATSGHCIQTIKNPSSMNGATFFSDGLHFMTAWFDICIWDITSGDLIRSFDRGSEIVESLAVSTDDRRIASASSDGTIQIWDAISGNCIQRFKADDKVESIAFFKDRQRVVSGSRTVQIWNAATINNGKQLCKGNDKSTDNHSRTINQIAFSDDIQRIASSSNDGTVKIWDADSGECRHTLKHHGGWAHGVVFSPDSRQLASSAHDENLKIWDVDSGECKHTFECHEESPYPFVFSPNGQQIAIALDKTIKIWNTISGTCENTINGDFKSTRRLVFSPDSQRIAADSKNNTITIWDTISGCRIRTFEAYEDSSGYIPFLNFSTDGQRITCAVRLGFTLDDRRLSIKNWDIASGNCVRTFEDHNGSEFSVDFSTSRHEMKHVSSNEAIRTLGVSTGESHWITLDGEALLWLPWDFRTDPRMPVYAVKGSTIAIGTKDCKVLVIRLALDNEAGAVLRPQPQ